MTDNRRDNIIQRRKVTDDPDGRFHMTFHDLILFIRKLAFFIQDVLRDPDLSNIMKKRRLTSAEIADANYQQEPVDIKGKLYSEFRTYEQLPRDAAGKLDFGAIISYTDTADTGSDDLCSIVAHP